MNNNHGYVNSDYLELAMELLRPIKQRSYTLLGHISNKRVLDIGCGPGLDTVAMAQLANGDEEIFGVDFDEKMITDANNRAAEYNLDTKVTHQQANAYELPFPDGYFDAIRSERLFIHLDSPEQALAEAIRVTRRGGKVVLVDTDWGSLSSHSGADEIEQRLVKFRAEQCLPNGYSGRRLFSLMKSLGLQNIIVESTAAHTTDLPIWQVMTQSKIVAELAVKEKIITQPEFNHWQDALNRTAKNDHFYGSVNIVTICGSIAV